ncbi:MAG: hypothetical protein SRB1_01777 [Desulfobacteraceae bacterium Eth-SRB1]|nr:MAG: hypothetical protein SRB1_01777 [Desulfobacteraceae bacterium Eth-SRB1]
MKLSLRTLFFLIFIYIFIPGLIYAEDKSSDTIDFDFEIPEVEKKPYSFNAEFKISETIKGFDEDSLLFNQKYPNGRDDDTFFQTYLNLKVEGSYRVSIVKLYARLNGDLYYNDDENWENDLRTEEAYLSLLPGPSITLDAGKKVLKWGKGYAWNPAAFFSRPKDIEDPDATLEGYYVVTGDLIKSMDGVLKTIALTPVILPVSRHINDEWGTERDTIWGSKIYFFAFDTDFDIMFLAGEEVEDRFGIDFSQNISANFEIHGEAAIVLDYVKYITDQQGNLTERKYDAINFLSGIRYLTSHDTTYIFEYYRNGQGYTSDEMEDYFALIEDGYQKYINSQSMAKLSKSRQYGSRFYNQQTAMKDYLYLKVSQKEPFDILYFTPSVACIYNINDKSASITPQITYAPITNLEFDLKSTFLLGKDHTEFGEKLNDYKVYASVKYYF